MSDKTKENKIAVTGSKLPTIQDMYDGKNLPELSKIDDFNVLLNQPPPKSWVKVHPFVKNHRYVPIDKQEWMLKRIFKQYRIEVLREGVAFNGVYVVVRVHYLHPVTGKWEFHDGIGAQQLQTKSGSSPADLGNINNGALSMAFPIAKTNAIKDALDHLGDAFGANLNRKDAIPLSQDEKLKDLKEEEERNRLKAVISASKSLNDLDKALSHIKEDDEDMMKLYDEKRKELEDAK